MKVHTQSTNLTKKIIQKIDKKKSNITNKEIWTQFESEMESAEPLSGNGDNS